MLAPKYRLLVLITLLHAPLVQANEPKQDARMPLSTGQLSKEGWLKHPTTPLQKGEIDRLVGANLKKANVPTAPLTTDEQFLRRATLDLTGRLPSPTEISAFLTDKSPEKRAQLIDKLLAGDDFAKHWALYFRDVIVSKTTDARVRLFEPLFQKWLTEQFKENKSWAAITRDLLTATGEMKQDAPDKNGQAFFLGTRFGADAQTELAAETSRIFLGIQIQCAQCHDHPSDVWKRQQFHEFAAFFARVRERPLRDGNRIVGQQIVSLPFGEHRMPDLEDPKKGKAMTPRFIDGRTIPTKRFVIPDQDRRQALADFITAKDNPWFAGAFVNRIWGELMGQAFYQPIDDMGPQKDALMPEVLARVAASFRGSDYDIKGLFREVMNSETYQRQIRPGESSDDHLLFAANSPTRLSANALWQTLTGTLGDLNARPGPFMKKGPTFGPFARFLSLEATFKQEFGFDPSTPGNEVEGSISQALLMMNNPVINQKIQARGDNMLARILTTYTQDDEALRIVYLRTLARRPTDRELARCKEHIRTTLTRAAAYEDILWALINSTEFQTQR